MPASENKSTLDSADGMPSMYCSQCRYPLNGLPSDRCPECGTKFDPADSHTFRTTLRDPLPWEPLAAGMCALMGVGVPHAEDAFLAGIGIMCSMGFALAAMWRNSRGGRIFAVAVMIVDLLVVLNIMMDFFR